MAKGNKVKTPTLDRKRLNWLVKFFTEAPSKVVNQDLWIELKEGINKANLCDLQKGCGTPGCIAGQTIIKWGPKSWYIKKINSDVYWSTESLFNIKGDQLDFSTEAKKLLGLTSNEGEWLFSSNDASLKDRKVILNRLKVILDPKRDRHGELPYKAMYGNW